ncbi:3-ketodihydrosphingosine reductase-like [Condylostylus longicornis]|uniref:3-ketodihydrosphingosine reductase-like n=1 Tax=Condylostylus longicornis TaxID=2530218 RepID=UPI00244E4946|nr:3-ketodihydrosphingosine reductase-like [Condylostylus longicornis]
MLVFGAIVIVATALLATFVLRWLRPKELEIKGKHVCITGGSEGIGLSLAQECVRKGAFAVTLIARSPKKLEVAVEQLSTTAGPYECRSASDSESNSSCVVRAFSCDVTDAQSVTKLFKIVNETSLDVFSKDSEGQEALAAAKSAGLVAIRTTDGKCVPTKIRPIDILINCAGTCVCDEFDSLEPQELEIQLRLNVCGTMYPCQELMKFVQREEDAGEHPKRVIVLLGSLASQLNIYGFVAYGASKFAIRGIWEALTMECDPLNIRIVCAFPPNTDTPGFEIENRRKPEITKIIEDTPGLYTADEVATSIIDGIERGKSSLVRLGHQRCQGPDELRLALWSCSGRPFGLLAQSHSQTIEKKYRE